MAQIISVIPLEDYRLKVLLGNGSSITLNLADKLNTVRFGMLSDEQFFRNVTTDGTVINWENKVELSASEVFQLAQK